MFFRKRKKELTKIVGAVRDSFIIQNYHNSSFHLKPLTQTELVCDRPVVVSLTSYSKRIDDVYLVLESLSLQTVLPNRVILWLAEDEVTFDDLPLTLKNRVEYGLEIKFCKDIKSYKKIIPTLNLGQDFHIITIDDDIIYPHDTIENFIRDHKKHPYAILGNRAHEVIFDKGRVVPYKRWNKEVKNQSDNIFLTGCGAIFYPNNSLDPRVSDEQVFMDICPHADDIWLYAMAKLQDSEIRKCNGRDFSQYIQIPYNQECGLNKFNVDRGENDKQLKAVVDYFELNI